MDIKDELKNIIKQLHHLENRRKKYLLANSADIFRYFEDKQKISSGENIQNVNILNSFFKINKHSENKHSENKHSDNKQSDNKHSENKQGDNITDDNNNMSMSRRTVKTYLQNICGKNSNTIQDFMYSSDICETCCMGELIPQDEEGILICNNTACGRFISYIVDSAKPSNKEAPNEVSYTAYIKLNHFKEVLSQFQAKETTQIPTEVIERIRQRIKKERQDVKLLNYKIMRDLLRKLGLNKYFEHIQYINSLFGIKPPIMEDKLIETLCVLFVEIQQPWTLYCPPERTNFFNYTYTLYQLCVLLGQHQYLPHIPLLKDISNQREQDQTWKKVCNHLDWQYFPTV